MGPLAFSNTHTQVLGTAIFHEEVGAGRPLVLLHGLNDSHRTWRTVVPELARTRRVLVPDLPGCGLSGRPDACYSLDWQATVVHTWLDALGLDDVDVVGHSYGGGVAQYMLLTRPRRIRRLALIAAGGLGRDVAFKLRLASLPHVVEYLGQPFMAPIAVRTLRGMGGVVTADEEAWQRAVNARPGTARAFARTVRDVIDWRGQTRHFLDRAREIAHFPPVALFWGSQDRIIPHAQALRTMSVMRGAELTTFPGCGHFPHQERPLAVAKALIAFMDSQEARPVSISCLAPAPPSWTSRLMAACRGALHPLHRVVPATSALRHEARRSAA